MHLDYLNQKLRKYGLVSFLCNNKKCPCMKNIYLSLLFIALITTTASAQFALESGYNNASMAITLNKAKIATKPLKGANFGMAADVCIDEHRHYYFQPGLFYQMGGCIIPATIPKDKDGGYDMTLFDLHLNIEYKTGEKCGARFTLGGGPVITYYTSGSYDIPAHDKVLRKRGDLLIGTEPRDDLKQRGLGLGINVGYQFKRHVYIRGFYNMGLSNVRAVGDPDNRIKTSAMGINLGYLFANCGSKKSHMVFARDKTREHWRGLSKGRYSKRVRIPRHE